MLKTILFLFSAGLFATSSPASGSDKVSPEMASYISDMDHQNKLSYNVMVRTWSIARTDTYSMREKIVLEKLPGDTMWGCKVYMSNLYGEKLYDGKNIYIHTADSGFLEKTLIEEQSVYPITGNASARGIHAEFADSTERLYDKKSSHHGVAARIVTDTFSSNDPAKSTDIQVIYSFKDGERFPSRILRKTVSKLGTSYRELSFSDVKYNVGIDAFSDLLFGHGYPIVITHPKLPEMLLPVGTHLEAPMGRYVQKNKVIDPEELKGKLLLLDFWFVGCKGCMLSIPDMNAVREKYPEEKLAIISINPTTDSEEGIKNVIKTYGMKYDVAKCSGEAVAKYSLSAFPTVYLLDRTGTIIYSGMGFNKPEVIKAIDSHL